MGDCAAVAEDPRQEAVADRQAALTPGQPPDVTGDEQERVEPRVGAEVVQQLVPHDGGAAVGTPVGEPQQVVAGAVRQALDGRRLRLTPQ